MCEEDEQTHHKEENNKCTYLEDRFRYICYREYIINAAQYSK